jgi:hypothetical protein
VELGGYRGGPAVTFKLIRGIVRATDSLRRTACNR